MIVYISRNPHPASAANHRRVLSRGIKAGGKVYQGSVRDPVPVGESHLEILKWDRDVGTVRI
jgi:hypothetical protein